MRRPPARDLTQAGAKVANYEASTAGATDVLDVDALYHGGLPIVFTPASKRLVFEFDSRDMWIDNLDGMTFGPDLPDGRKTLVIVSDQ